MKKMNEAGLSIVEMIFAMALLAVGALIAAKLTTDSSRAGATVKMKQDLRTAMTLVKQAILSPQGCDANFSPANFTAGATLAAAMDLNELRTKPPLVAPFTGQLIFKTGTYFLPGLKIASIQLTNFQIVKDKNLYWANLVVTGQKDPGSFMGDGNNEVLSMPVILTADGATPPSITGCGSTTPPEPITMTGCWSDNCGGGDDHPCDTLIVRGHSFHEEPTASHNIPFPSCQPCKIQRTVLCVAD